jgi:hypothetical protein
MPSAESGSGSLVFVSVAHKPMAILRALPDVLRRKLRPGKGRHVGRADHLCLRFSGTYTIDGEMYDATDERELTLDSRDTLRFIQLPS